MKNDALSVLDKSPAHPLISLWKAYLNDDASMLVEVAVASPEFVFPYRTETVAALEWAVSKNNNWKFRYYLALNYYAVQRTEDAAVMLQNCRQEPDFAPFYLTRASLLTPGNDGQYLPDLNTAQSLTLDDWRTMNMLIRYYNGKKDYKMSLSLASSAYKKHKDNSILGLQYSIALINNKQYAAGGSSMSLLSDKEGTDNDHTDGKVATEVIKLLEKHKDEPFFIGAGFYKPHCPWITPSKYFDLYRADDMSLPKISEETKNEYPQLALTSTQPWPYFGITSDQAMECKLAYFAAISFVDAQIGRLLDALDSLGLSDNTIVVFWSDHGYHLGEHGLWFKQSCFEESAKTPFILSVPGSKTAGRLCYKPVELVDIYPTLAELTGLIPPATLEGLSLSPLLQDPDAAWSHPAYTQVKRGNTPGHSVRTEVWRYTEWGYGKMGEELYNEITDPQELNNLAGNPKYAEIINEMKILLKNIHPVAVDGGKAIPDTKARFID